MQSTLRLGTRKSLLATAQSQWVALELEKKAASLGIPVKVELIGIETQGDRVLDKPLSEMEGKEFFTAELDRALIDGSVDFTVHSLKDLSLDRPPMLTIAATPKREKPHDVAIFHQSVIARLKAGLPIRIGTSSPRRLSLVPRFLEQALPRWKSPPKLQFSSIRGNVNTRLSRIHEPEGSDRKLDGVILAWAGLSRLSIDPVGRTELAKLFANSLMMILPLRENPTAPGQGALAIEARSDRADLVNLIRTLHDPTTLEAITEERKVLAEWGGGCHQKLGASRTAQHFFVRGQKANGEFVERTTGVTGFDVPKNYHRVDTRDVFDLIPFAPRPDEQSRFDLAQAVFVAHARAFDFLPVANQETLRSAQKRVWVSGTKTWFKLAAEGVWVEGCTESHGIRILEEWVAQPLLKLNGADLIASPWVLLTHAESLAMTPHFSFSISVFPTYAHEFVRVPQSIEQNDAFYWGSGLVFSEVFENLPHHQKADFLKKKHACGPGRTMMVLRQYGLNPELILE